MDDPRRNRDLFNLFISRSQATTTPGAVIDQLGRVIEPGDLVQVLDRGQTLWRVDTISATTDPTLADVTVVQVRALLQVHVKRGQLAPFILIGPPPQDHPDVSPVSAPNGATS